MKQYGTESQYLDVLVSDFSLPLWRQDLKFDAIITDRKFSNAFHFLTHVLMMFNTHIASDFSLIMSPKGMDQLCCV